MRFLAAAAVLLFMVGGCTHPSGRLDRAQRTPASSPSGPTPSAPRAAGVRVIRSRLAPERAPGAVSRLTVTPGSGGTLLLAGGLSAGTSTSAVYAFDTGGSRFRAVGSLAVPTHDAAAMRFRGHTFVLGGGSSSTTDLVQELGPAGRAARVVGHLPQPRSDAVAVQSATTGYLVGGYDGAAGDRQVLATHDGRTFRRVATLPVAVRYAAVTVVGDRVLVFGGLAVGGRHDGQPVDLIQEVEPLRHRARVVGHLPEPLQGAVAVTLGATAYVAGGRSSSSTSAPASRSIYAYEPAKDAVRRAGRLPLGVANAGIAARGQRAWVIGGESSGRTRSSVQTITQEVSAP